MTKLFVPIRTYEKDKENLASVKLFEVNSHLHNATLFNGCPFLRQKTKLRGLFPNKNFDFHIVQELAKNDFNDFNGNEDSSNIDSMSLGILCSAYATYNKMSFKQKYGSITITGDYEVHNGNVVLKDVALIKDKFEAIQRYAKRYPNDNHLFVYVSKKEEISNGVFSNNLTVYHLGVDFNFDEFLSEIFDIDADDERTKIIEQLPYETSWIFLETSDYMRIRHSVFSSKSRYFSIEGNGECGKTAIMYNIMRDNVKADSEIIPVWITINNEKISDLFLLDTNTQDESQYVYNYFFSILQSYFDKGKLLVCIDNLEIDKSSEIIDVLEKILQENKIEFKVILTSRFVVAEDRENIIRFLLREFDETEINAFAWQMSGKKQLQEDLLRSLFENLKNEPGLIPSVLSLVKSDSIALDISRRLNENSREKSDTVFTMVFNDLSIENKIILFVAVSIGLKGQTITVKSIKECLEKKIKKIEEIYNQSFYLDEDTIIETFAKLIKFNIFVKEKDSYFSISVPQSFFTLTNLDDLEEKLRDVFITYEYRLIVAVIKNQISSLKNLLRQYNDSFENLLRLEMRAIAVNSDKKIVSILLSKAFEYIAKGNINSIEDKESSEFKSTAFYLNSKIPLECLTSAAQQCKTDSEGYFAVEDFTSELLKINKGYIIYGDVYDFLMHMYPRYFKPFNGKSDSKPDRFKIKNHRCETRQKCIVKKWVSSLRYGFLFSDTQTDVYFDFESFEKFEDIQRIKRGAIVSCYFIDNDYYDPQKPEKTNCRFKARPKSLIIEGFESDLTTGIKRLISFHRSDKRN